MIAVFEVMRSLIRWMQIQFLYVLITITNIIVFFFTDKFKLKPLSISFYHIYTQHGKMERYIALLGYDDPPKSRRNSAQLNSAARYDPSLITRCGSILKVFAFRSFDLRFEVQRWFDSFDRNILDSVSDPFENFEDSSWRIESATLDLDSIRIILHACTREEGK